MSGQNVLIMFGQNVPKCGQNEALDNQGFKWEATAAVRSQLHRNIVTIRRRDIARKMLIGTKQLIQFSLMKIPASWNARVAHANQIILMASGWCRL